MESKGWIELMTEKVVKNTKATTLKRTKRPAATKVKKPETAKQKRQWLWEFSKRIVVFVAVFFFILTIYTLIFLLKNPDSTAINGVYTDISNVFKWTVVAYAVKAGFENIWKIKESFTNNEEE